MLGRQACNLFKERPLHLSFRTSRLQDPLQKRCSWIMQKIHRKPATLDGSETPGHLFKSTFSYRTSSVTSSDSSGFQPEHLLIKYLPVTDSCVYLWILRSCSDRPFYRALLGNWLSHVQVAGFQPSYTVKKGISQGYFILYKNKKWLFEGVHLFKIPENCLLIS